MRPRFEVQIVNPADGRPKVWKTYAKRELTEAEATKLRHHKFFVQVRRIVAELEQEHVS